MELPLPFAATLLSGTFSRLAFNEACHPEKDRVFAQRYAASFAYQFVSKRVGRTRGKERERERDVRGEDEEFVRDNEK